MNGLFSAVSGASAQELWLDKVTNNLANVNTSGFKGAYPSFESQLVESASRIYRDDEASSSVVLVKMNDGLDLSQGVMKSTGNPLDLAIEGEGYFAVETPAGMRYTRGGSFLLDREGILSTSEGFPLLGKGGEIKISGSDIVIAGDGDVTVDGNSVGNIKVVKFQNDKDLTRQGSSLFKLAEGGEERDAEDSSILQGYVEMSNVKVVTEMTRLINISRAYESYQKVIGYMNDVHSKVINEIGRPS